MTETTRHDTPLRKTHPSRVSLWSTMMVRAPVYYEACQAGSRPVQARNASESVESAGAGFSAAKTRALRTCSEGIGSITACANSIASAGITRSNPALLAISHPWMYRSRAGKLKPSPVLRRPIGESTSRDRSTPLMALRAWSARPVHHVPGTPSMSAPGGSTGDQEGRASWSRSVPKRVAWPTWPRTSSARQHWHGEARSQSSALS